MFDPNYYGKALQISCDGRSVKADDEGYGVVLGKEPLKLGDEWKMKVNCSEGMIVCGVASKPVPGGLDGNPGDCFKSDDQFWGWYNNRKLMCGWKRGDQVWYICDSLPLLADDLILMFSLSHNCTLTVVYDYKGKERRRTIVDIDGEVYVYVCTSRGSQVELI